MRLLITTLLAALICVTCSPKVEKDFKSADLIFVVTQRDLKDSGSMDDAIALATGDIELSATHVGVLEVADDSVWVIDATPRHGVSRRTLDTFKKEMSDGQSVSFVVKRIRGDIDTDSIISKAKTYLGKKYDFAFSKDNDSYYCSEFVQVLFTGKDGTPVFPSAPMNFQSADGTFPQYWIELFESLSLPIPQGEPGTNPSDMMRSPMLQEPSGLTSDM